ncbi:MAG: holo-[acyl-carrier-protein] synthase [Symploca sp. SIO2D2]|nr:holo-[acyl-carrier-protein] synthase [Symploca sp. SIO2D2]
MISLPFNGPIMGIGVDIVDIARIREIYDRQGERFLARVFTETEQSYCLRMKFPHKHLAARFAAKEAVSKAFSTGIGDFLNWTSISVVSGTRGEPTIVLDEKGQELLRRVGGAAVAVSLSHTEETAIAFAAIVGK